MQRSLSSAVSMCAMCLPSACGGRGNEGEPGEVTGVMKNPKEKQVFVTRTVKARGQVYPIRNMYGIPVSSQSRERAGEKAAQKAESL